MAYSKTLWLIAVFLAVVAAVSALPGPKPQESAPVAPARIQPKEAESAEKTDLKAENSHGFGYAYGPYGGYGHLGYGGWGYGGYGYPYGYAYGYPYGGWGGYGGYYWG